MSPRSPHPSHLNREANLEALPPGAVQSTFLPKALRNLKHASLCLTEVLHEPRVLEETSGLLSSRQHHFAPSHPSLHTRCQRYIAKSKTKSPLQVQGVMCRVARQGAQTITDSSGYLCRQPVTEVQVRGVSHHQHKRKRRR